MSLVDFTQLCVLLSVAQCRLGLPDSLLLRITESHWHALNIKRGQESGAPYCCFKLLIYSLVPSPRVLWRPHLCIYSNDTCIRFKFCVGFVDQPAAYCAYCMKYWDTTICSEMGRIKDWIKRLGAAPSNLLSTSEQNIFKDVALC